MATWIEKVKETRLRHNQMSCKVFELKIDKSHLSIEKYNYLKSLFLESKWLYNYILSQDNIFEFDTKIKDVIVLNKDRKPETRMLNNLSSQMKQSVQQKLMNAVKGLSSKKKKGKHKTGKIKFTSNYQALTLNQYNITYRIKDNKYLVLQGKNKLKIKIEGLKQISKESEITNAILLYRHNDLYLKVTCFLPKTNLVPPEESVGIDFGISTTLTLSTGEKIDLKVPENWRLRRTSRKLKKKIKGSKNYIKKKEQLNLQYHKQNNRKKDIKNKIVHSITKKYKKVIVQDENILGWKNGRYGKQVQHSLMNGIMRDLESKSHTFIKVDRFFPSTQLCPVCGTKKKMPVKIRIYECNNCGYKEDRDTKSATCIEKEGLRLYSLQILTERKKLTPVEKSPLLNNACLEVEQVFSLNQEASTFR